MAVPETKKEIRKRYLSLRNGMNEQETAELSEGICRNILSNVLFYEAEWIFAYHPLGNEADIRPVILEAWKTGKRVAFPKVFGDDMSFFEVREFSELQPGCFGVLEPEALRPAVVPQAGTLVLVPGVAFDRNGNRMGFGRGYYDRYLAQYSGYTALGAAYELQLADHIPVEDTDIRMDLLATEKKLYLFSCA